MFPLGLCAAAQKSRATPPTQHYTLPLDDWMSTWCLNCHRLFKSRNADCGVRQSPVNTSHYVKEAEPHRGGSRLWSALARAGRQHDQRSIWVENMTLKPSNQAWATCFSIQLLKYWICYMGWIYALYAHTVFYLSRVNQAYRDKRLALLWISPLKEKMVCRVWLDWLGNTYSSVQPTVRNVCWWVFHREQKSMNVCFQHWWTFMYHVLQYLYGLMQKQKKAVFVSCFSLAEKQRFIIFRSGGVELSLCSKVVYEKESRWHCFRTLFVSLLVLCPFTMCLPSFREPVHICLSSLRRVIKVMLVHQVLKARRYFTFYFSILKYGVLCFTQRFKKAVLRFL